MKTLDEAIKAYQNNKEVIDIRFGNRFADFIPEDRLHEIGIELKSEYKGKHEHKPWREEEILNQLEQDVEFGFEKALDQRGISSSLMYDVVKRWNEILENNINEEINDNYAQYGLPLFKATAIHYGWNNPIGDDTGSELKYSSDY